MRAYIKLWGNEYPVTSVWWDKGEGYLKDIYFRDELGNTHTVFHAETTREPTRKDDIKHANLNELVFWKYNR